MTWKVAIIGCGAMGNVHAGIWSARDDADVVAVFDPDAERCAALAQSSGAAACTTLEAAIVDADVDVVSVCTPANLHCEVSCLAMAHGRHVLCEKAMATTLAEADKMITTASANNVKLGISYQYRSFPKSLAYRGLIHAGAFGGPVMARFVDVREVRPKLAMHRRSMNGGPVIDMAGHFFDLMRFITGEEPEAVYARGHVFGAVKPRLEGIDDLAIDAAEITVGFSGGHVLSVNVNWGMPEGHPGVVREELIGPELIMRPTEKGAEAIYADRVEAVEPEPLTPVGVGTRIQDLLTAIEHDTKPEVAGKDGRIALAVCLAALTSIETGDVVHLA